MSMLEKINDALKEAMKVKDADRIDSVRAIKSAVNYKKAEAGKDPDDAEIIELIAKEAKKRRDSIAQFRAAAREDLAAREEAQLAIISEFLPAQMSDEELEAKIKEIIAQLGATSQKEMGKVMGKAMAEMKGKADGTKVKDIAARLLS